MWHLFHICGRQFFSSHGHEVDLQTGHLGPCWFIVFHCIWKIAVQQNTYSLFPVTKQTTGRGDGPENVQHYSETQDECEAKCVDVVAKKCLLDVVVGPGHFMKPKTRKSLVMLQVYAFVCCSTHMPVLSCKKTSTAQCCNWYKTNSTST